MKCDSETKEREGWFQLNFSFFWTVTVESFVERFLFFFFFFSPVFLHKTAKSQSLHSKHNTRSAHYYE